MAASPSSLVDVLDRIEQAAKGGKAVTFDAVLDAIGRRSFGPLLVVAGLVILAPVVGDVPGMPTAVAVFVALVAGQIVVGRQHLWLPEFLLRRSLPADKLRKPLQWFRRPARVTDRLFRRRLPMLVGELTTRMIAGVCLLVSVVIPALELIPFSANAAGIVLLTFGVAIVVRDGLMVIVGAVATVATLVIVAMAML